MHALAMPATNLFSSAVEQAVSGFASRASAAIKGFESDVQAGNGAGAQSFLSALQQKVTAQGAPASGTVSAQFSQVSNDLQAGNLLAAQADFSTLATSLSQLKHRSAQPSASANNSQPSTPNSGDGNSDLPTLQSLSGLQQSAYDSALSLSLPSAVPSLSINSW